MSEHLHQALDAMKQIPALVEEHEPEAVAFAFACANAYAAIAQAEAAERQADTQESIMALVRRQTEAMERITELFGCAITSSDAETTKLFRVGAS